ncbi:sensor histidine kinase [Phenylobacterium sp.]|uniref:sensor histidine kinase n=1 Tax=Phenylobacterium sp. TaxID=1871053 RepID=UPI0027362ACD|nr:sensor histidine kinase [Phenylobacterium sp.]MDP3853076.1 sensor histidine kinase [Phenylobacterium sp.]
MRGLGDLNLPERLAGVAPRWAVEAACAGTCVAAAGVLRMSMELFTAQVAPFIFVGPAVLAATLLAGWRAGLACLAIGLAGVWYIALPPERFGPLSLDDGASMVLNAFSALLVIGLAQLFRRAASADGDERTAKLEVRDLLLRELNHRVKNNFQMVAGLLDMQRRRAADPGTEAALSDALRRVHSMAQAHAYLYSPGESVGSIDLAAYLRELCESLADSLLLTGAVRLSCDLESGAVSRDRAVALGLVVNELVTNAAKYAFPDDRPGAILVALTRIEIGLELTVADDGVGMPPEGKIKTTGLGRRLVESFARQGGAILTRGEGPGTRYVLVLPD